MTTQQFGMQRKGSMSKITMILAVAVVAAAIGIFVSIYYTGTIVPPPNSEHATNSPFSPLINKDNAKPQAQPFASLAKQIESGQVTTP